jgi:integrase
VIGKTRRRRIVDLEPAAKRWLDLGQPLPLRNIRRRFDTVKGGLGFTWSQDVMRHSFCSYHLAAFENAARTAMQAGHTEKVLFTNYREIVTKAEAQAFWQL